MSMIEGLALGRITQPSSQLHNRTNTLGYRLRRFAQPHTYDSRKIWWGATNCDRLSSSLLCGREVRCVQASSFASLAKPESERLVILRPDEIPASFFFASSFEDRLRDVTLLSCMN